MLKAVTYLIYIFGTPSQSIVFLEVIKKGKKRVNYFSQQLEQVNSLFLLTLLPPRPSEQHLNITFYLNRRMKFVFVLSLMLCYSLAQSADLGEYIVQSNLRE